MSDDVKTEEPAEDTKEAGAIDAQDAANLAFEDIESDDGNTKSAADDVFDADQEEQKERDLTAIYDIPVQISAVLGRSSMLVSQLLKLGRGAVIELDRRVGEPIDIYVNNRLVARGEVVVVEDKLGITMTEIVKAESN